MQRAAESGLVLVVRVDVHIVVVSQTAKVIELLTRTNYALLDLGRRLWTARLVVVLAFAVTQINVPFV